MNAQIFKNAFDRILNSTNVLLVTHVHPDGDALSSICTMIEILEENAINYTAYCKDTPPVQFDFLPNFEKIVSDQEKITLSDFDTIITLDCGSLSRTGILDEILARAEDQKVIEFDHHPRVDDFAEYEVRLPELSSTAEVLYHLIRINKIRINKEIATCLLTGILTDTGNLLYESTTDNTVQIASKMLLHGARYPSILEKTWRNKSLHAMKTWGKAMSNLRVNKKYNIAYTILDKEDLEASGASEEELEGIPSFLSNLDDINALIFMRQEKPGLIKGSLRTSNPDVDVSKLASAMGGGGHKKASGFVIYGDIVKTEDGWYIN